MIYKYLLLIIILFKSLIFIHYNYYKIAQNLYLQNKRRRHTFLLVVFVEIVITENFFEGCNRSSRYRSKYTRTAYDVYRRFPLPLLPREAPENGAIHVRVGPDHFCICLKF